VHISGTSSWHILQTDYFVLIIILISTSFYLYFKDIFVIIETFFILYQMREKGKRFFENKSFRSYSSAPIVPGRATVYKPPGTVGAEL